MYAEMIVKDIFPDRTLAKELARNSLQEVLDSVSASKFHHCCTHSVSNSP